MSNRNIGGSRNKFGGVLAALMITAIGLAAAGPARADDKLLSAERWRETSFGLSLRPPLGSRLVEQTADAALVRIVGEPSYLMAVHLRASEHMVTVEEVQTYALQQVIFAYPKAVIIEQEPMEFQGHPGAMFLFSLPADPETKRGKWVIGQTVVQLDNTTVALIQVEMPREELEPVRKIYKAMLNSIEFQDPVELHRQRNESLDRGQMWLNKIDAPQLHQARIADQWFRVVNRDEEIGFIRIKQQADTALDEAGLRVDLHAQLQTGDTITESTSNFFLSDSLDHEVWSIRTTVRAAVTSPANRQQSRETIWTETGVRSDGRITITRESPSGKKELNYEIPEGYLPQVVAHQITSLLPRQLAKAGESELMGFYCYYPNNGKISYRTERVVMKPDGSFNIMSRPTPEQQEQVSEFDARGKLIRRVLPSGWIMLPATESQVRMKWNLPGR